MPQGGRLRAGRVEQGSAWALVTGAGSGIGRCYARQLAALGYNIVAVGSDPAPLAALAAEIHHIRVHILALDLARPEAAQELYDRVAAAGIAVDVLVNNAGIFSFCDIASTPARRIERIILLHNLTLTQLCRLYAADMIRRGVCGHILNMSSYSLWMPFPGLSLYSASKAYVRAFSIAFAKEVHADGILVTAVCPAGVATDFFGLTSRWKRIACRYGVLIKPETCVRRALRALWRGRRCVVPDWWNRAWIPLCKILPMWVLRPVRAYTMRFQK